jgi:hypothetical protein
MINLKTVKQLVDERYEGENPNQKCLKAGPDWGVSPAQMRKWYDSNQIIRKTLLLMHCFDTEAEAEEYAEQKQMKERA